MIKHSFSFPKSLTAQIDKHFDAVFSSADGQLKDHIPEDHLFEKTEIFSHPLDHENKITLTTSDPGTLRMISHALSLQKHKLSISFIGESAICDEQYTYFKENTQENILLKNSLAEQGHLNPHNDPSPLDLRLGVLRRDISTTRCHLADSTIVFLNINALKWTDAPAQSGNNPCGLTTEEANQLAYMAGQSQKNKFLILYGFDHPDCDPYHLSINSAIQILWYYQYAASTKPQLWPIPEDHQQDFTIESSMMSGNLLFRKDRITNNWFHKIPFDLPPELAHHQWIASSHEEYLSAANEDLPLRILEWYELGDSHQHPSM